MENFEQSDSSLVDERTLGKSKLPVVSSSFAAQAMLECHYCKFDAFMTPNQIIENIDAVRNIPTVAVHGSLDFICPVRTAWDLHTAWPEAELRVVGGAGHSMYDLAITHELLVATDNFRNLSVR